MTKKSVTKRIRITKRGKLIRRHMGLSHFRVKKTTKQMQSRKGTYIINSRDVKSIVKLINKT